MSKPRFGLNRILIIAYCLIFMFLFADQNEVYAEIDPELANALQKALDEFASKYKITGATLAIILPDQGTWVWACGMADPQVGIAMVPENLLRIASITKTFVAATILRLAEEDILTLEDSVEQWLPGLVPNGENITIRDLLRHTSGLFSYTDVWFAEADKDHNKVWQPEEVVAMATDRPPIFAPGERHSYCNTGYILLGMIIETATGSPVEQEIRQRLLEPLQLNNTFLDGREEIPEGLALSPTAPVPYTSLATGAWTAGGMVSNAEDLAKWAKALYSGEVLEQASLDEMLTFANPSPGYGLGVMMQSTIMGSSVGHDGGITGYDSKMYYIPDTSIAIATLAYGNSGGLFYTALKTLSNPEAVSVSGKLVTTWGTLKHAQGCPGYVENEAGKFTATKKIVVVAK